MEVQWDPEHPLSGPEIRPHKFPTEKTCGQRNNEPAQIRLSMKYTGYRNTVGAVTQKRFRQVWQFYLVFNYFIAGDPRSVACHQIHHWLDVTVLATKKHTILSIFLSK